MLQETILMKQAFVKRTGINPLKFKLQQGSMKPYISIEIEGSKEDYNILEQSRIIGDVKITFIQDLTFLKKPRIHLDIEIRELINKVNVI